MGGRGGWPALPSSHRRIAKSLHHERRPPHFVPVVAWPPSASASLPLPIPRPPGPASVRGGEGGAGLARPGPHFPAASPAAPGFSAQAGAPRAKSESEGGCRDLLRAHPLCGCCPPRSGREALEAQEWGSPPLRGPALGVSVLFPRAFPLPGNMWAYLAHLTDS